MLKLIQKHEDRPFNPWRQFTEKAQPFVQTVLSLLASHEPPRRARGEQDQLRYVKLVSALLADLAYNLLMNEPVSIHVTRNKTILQRAFIRPYRPSFLRGQMLPTILDALQTSSLIEMVKGHHGKHVSSSCQRETRITGTRLLEALLSTYEVSLDQIYADYTGQEIVVLRGTRDVHYSEAELEDYEDTETTVVYREEVRAINAWLQKVRLRCSGLGGLALPGIDVRERHLRRHFTRSSFSSGGRLFGGFWQPMHKEDRLQYLRIDDEAVTEVDYSSMVPRLLYGVSQQAIPTALQQDLYRIPGFERSRDGIKILFNALLFTPTKLTRFPDESKPLFDAEELKKVGSKVQPIIEAIKQAHYPVAHQFNGSQIGHHLMFVESQILVDLLLRLKDMGIPALPIHDAVLIGKRWVEVTEEVMLEVFKKMAGIKGRVKSQIYQAPQAA